VRLFCSHATDQQFLAQLRVASDGRRLVLERLIIGLTKRLGFAGIVADTTGWDLAVAITNLRDAASSSSSSSCSAPTDCPTQPVLATLPTATWGGPPREPPGVDRPPDAVVERLLDLLNRSVNGGVAPVP